MKKFSVVKTTLISLAAAIFILAGCENQNAKSEDTGAEVSIEESISSLEEELFNSTAIRLDKRKALDLIRLYERFADTYPEDERSPDYLFKAADISMNLRRPQSTIALFNRVINEYPDYRNSPSALFLKAFVYEDQLQDYENAKVYYQEFLQKYPKSEFADDAEVSLKNLGKSPEELIKEFEQQGNQ